MRVGLVHKCEDTAHCANAALQMLRLELGAWYVHNLLPGFEFDLVAASNRTTITALVTPWSGVDADGVDCVSANVTVHAATSAVTHVHIALERAVEFAGAPPDAATLRRVTVDAQVSACHQILSMAWPLTICAFSVLLSGGWEHKPMRVWVEDRWAQRVQQYAQRLADAAATPFAGAAAKRQPAAPSPQSSQRWLVEALHIRPLQATVTLNGSATV